MSVHVCYHPCPSYAVYLTLDLESLPFFCAPVTRKRGNGPQSRYCVVPKLPDYISLWCVCKGTAKTSLPPLVGIRFMNVCDQVRHQQVNVNPPDSYAVSPLVFGTRTCCFPHGSTNGAMQWFGERARIQLHKREMWIIEKRWRKTK